jgi:hypothetical protein
MMTLMVSKAKTKTKRATPRTSRTRPPLGLRSPKFCCQTAEQREKALVALTVLFSDRLKETET